MYRTKSDIYRYAGELTLRKIALHSRKKKTKTHVILQIINIYNLLKILTVTLILVVKYFIVINTLSFMNQADAPGTYFTWHYSAKTSVQDVCHYKGPVSH